MKADIETILDVRAAAELAGRSHDLRIFSCANPELSSPYNVLKHGSANQIRDRLMMSFEWSEEFYKNQCGNALLLLLKGLVFVRDTDRKDFDLFTVHRLVTVPSAIQDLSKEIGKRNPSLKSLIFDLYQEIKVPENLAHLAGLKSQIGSLIHSDFGYLLSSQANGIDLFESVNDGKIVYILLDSRRYGESSKALGKMILEDLKSTSARIDNQIKAPDRKPFTIVVDEFADMVTDGFIGLLDRARSSKMGIVVAHQEIADLERIDKTLRKRLMNSTSTLFAFLQKDPESSELIAGIAGTKASKAETERSESGFFGDQMTGQKSVRITEEYIIHPNDVKTLKVGECVMVEKYPVSRARLIKIDLPKRIAHGNLEQSRSLNSEATLDELSGSGSTGLDQGTKPDDESSETYSYRSQLECRSTKKPDALEDA